jgi:4-hydroxybenzoate polyprenyltransferase
VGPAVIEGIFMILIVVFAIYCRRGQRWSFAGVVVIGVLYSILSAAIYFQPGPQPPWASLGLAIWLTVLPALVALAGVASLIQLRR